MTKFSASGLNFLLVTKFFADFFLPTWIFLYWRELKVKKKKKGPKYVLLGDLGPNMGLKFENEITYKFLFSNFLYSLKYLWKYKLTKMDFRENNPILPFSKHWKILHNVSQ